MKKSFFLSNITQPVNYAFILLTLISALWGPLILIKSKIYSSLMSITQESFLASSQKNKSKVLRQFNLIETLSPFDNSLLMQRILLNSSNMEKSQLVKSLEEVRRRNARDRRALILLLYLHLDEKNWSHVIEQINILFRLDGQEQNRETYYDILAKVHATQEGRIIIEEQIKNNPNWSWGFILKRIKDSEISDLKALHATLEAYSVNLSPIQYESIYGLYFTELTAKREVNYAYEKWNDILNNNATYKEEFRTGNIVFNKYFRDIVIPIPFNWKIYSGSDTESWFEENSGLSFRTKSEQYVKIAQEIIPLNTHSSNEYELEISFKSSHNYLLNSGQILVHLMCYRDQTILLSQTLSSKEFSREASQFNSIIKVPNQCDWGYIQLYVSKDTKVKLFTGSIQSLSIRSHN